jgi:hypothetical protein
MPIVELLHDLHPFAAGARLSPVQCLPGVTPHWDCYKYNVHTLRTQFPPSQPSTCREHAPNTKYARAELEPYTDTDLRIIWLLLLWFLPRNTVYSS